MGKLGVIDPLSWTAIGLTAASGLTALGSTFFEAGKGGSALQDELRKEKAAQIRAETIRRQTLAQEQQRQQEEAVLGVSQQRRAEQVTFLVGLGVLAAGVAGVLLYQAFKKKG